MSRLQCTCGHIIRDKDDDLPYKGTIYKADLVRDKSYWPFWDGLLADIDHFLIAVAEGRRDQWIAEHFGERYPSVIVYTLKADTVVVVRILHVPQQRPRTEGQGSLHCEPCPSVLARTSGPTLGPTLLEWPVYTRPGSGA